MNIILENRFSKKIIEIIYNPILLSVLLLLMILLGVTFSGGMIYETSDDHALRVLTDGSFNNTFVGSYFLLYSSSVIGRLLVFFYSHFPDCYWYDIMEFFLMSFATLVIGYSVFSKKDSIYNIFCFLTLFFILIPLFIQPQFSIVAGTLTISAIIYAIKLLNEGINRKLHIFFSILILFFLCFFAGLIRNEVYLIVMCVGFVYFSSFVNKGNYKRFFVLVICGGFIALAVLAVFHICAEIDMSNPEIDYTVKANKYLVLLFNNTIAGNNLQLPWVPIEATVKDLSQILSKYGWYKGDYRLLLSWADIGDFDVFSNYNKSLIVKALGDLISIKSNYVIGFSIQDYLKLFKIYLLIPFLLLIIFFDKKTLAHFLFYIGLFFLLVSVLNIFFRSLPPRIWVNFCNLYIFVFLYYIKINSKSVINKLENIELNYKKLVKIAFLVFFIMIFISISMVLWKKTAKRALMIKKDYSNLIRQFDSLDDRKIYLVDVFVLEIGGRPFKKSIFQSEKKILPLGGTEFFQHKKLFESLGLPKKNTWNHICAENNVEILTYVDGSYPDFYFTQIKQAVTQHMKDRYHKNVIFSLSQNFGNLQSYRCVTKK